MPNKTVGLGATVGIPVRVEAGQVASADIWIEYDPAYLAPTGDVSLGSLFSGLALVDTVRSDVNQVRVALAGSQFMYVPVRSDLVVVYFEVLQSSGTSQITFQRSVVNGSAVTGTAGTLIFAPPPSTFTLPDVVVDTGGKVAVALESEAVAGVRGIDLWIEYNSLAVLVDSVRLDPALVAAGFQMELNLDDLLHVKASLASASPTAISGPLLHIYFRAVGTAADSSELRFEKLVVNEGLVATIGEDGFIAINGPPLLNNPGSFSVTAGSPLTFRLSASDPDGDSLTFSATGLPSGATLGVKSGNFTWTPSAAGTFTVAFSASDGRLISNTRNVAITVTEGTAPPPPANNPPVLGTLNNVTVNAGQTVTVTAQATDADNDPLQYVFSGTATTTGQSFSTGVNSFSWPVQSTTPSSTYQLTVTVSDGKGGTASLTISVTVVGVNHPPVIGPITDVTINQGALATFTVTVTDEDGDAVTVGASGEPFGLSPAATFNAATRVFSWQTSTTIVGNFTVTITATDSRGGSVVKTVNISVGSVNRAPVLAPVGAKSVVSDGSTLAFTLSATDPDANTTLAYSASGLPPGATFNQLTGAFSFKPALNTSGTFSTTFRVSDGTLFAQEVVAITVTAPALPPVFTPPAITIYTAVPGQTLSFTVTATDPAGELVTLSATGLPAGATFNAATGLFTFTPTFAQGGQSFNPRFSATDPGGLVANLITIIINVQSLNRPPVMNDIPNQTVLAGSLLQFTAVATDPDADPLTFTAIGLPSGATLGASTGAFAWTPAAGSPSGNFPVTISVSDGRGGVASRVVQITVGNVNRPPTIAAILSQVITERETLLVNVTVTDPDVGNVVQVSVSPLPPGATFSFTQATGTGQLRYIPALGAAGAYNLSVLASDGKLTASQAFTITVNRLSVVPVLSPIGNRTVNVNQVLAFQISASDPAGREAISLSLTGLPLGAKFDAGTGAFSWTPDFNQAGSYPLTATATNASALTKSETFTITVVGVNRPPVISPIPNLAVLAGALVELTVVASDPDADALTLSAVGDPLSLGATFDAASGKFRWVPAATAVGNFRLVFAAVDGKGGRAELAVIITVGAVNRPPALGTLVDKTVNAGELLSFTFTATDPDGDALTLALPNRPAGAVATFSAGAGTFNWTPTLEQVGVFNVDFIVKDASLTAQKTVVITVLKVNRAPVVTSIGQRTVSEG
ncbi:MAG TPA: putative Ig domain-containing protein, partial [Candidatus Glassbacteria bacterium]|nr:putative Ig domain-containing protein [Candidatus Glassbacteria bacterium]